MNEMIEEIKRLMRDNKGITPNEVINALEEQEYRMDDGRKKLVHFVMNWDRFSDFKLD